MLSTPPPIHRLQSGGAEAVDLHAGSLEIPPGSKRCSARDHRALFAHRTHAADHHIVHLRCIKLGTRCHVLHELGEKADGFDLVECTARLAPTARRAYCLIDVNLSHDAPQVRKPAARRVGYAEV